MGIEVLGRSEYFRLLSTRQSLRYNETMLTGMAEDSNKLQPFRVGIVDKRLLSG